MLAHIIVCRRECIRHVAAIAVLDQCGEVFGEMALWARLDTRAVNSLSDLGLFSAAGAKSLRRIAPGPQLGAVATREGSLCAVTVAAEPVGLAQYCSNCKAEDREPSRAEAQGARPQLEQLGHEMLQECNGRG